MAVALETIVKQLTDSGIIAPGKLENFVPPNASPKDAEELVAELVKQKHLTPFQAQQVKTGRSRSLILGSYTIVDKIGAGGMGQVFKAQHRRMDRTVAIKMLPPSMMKDAAAAARFEREVRAAAKLEHPNIVTAYDADQANGVHFLVMQFVDGQDLSALVKKNGPFPVAKAVNYILQAARGLEFAHGEGVVHRDIKPANLLLDKKGVVKILDMGLARIDVGGNVANQAELTGTGTVMGTVDYMAPEQGISTKNADARADIYSLGCTLHYLLIGKATYDGETIAAKLVAHHTHPLPNLRQLRDEVPEQVEAVFKKMVAKSVEDRYQTMTEVMADLEKCQAKLGATTNTATSVFQSTAINEPSGVSNTVGNPQSRTGPATATQQAATIVPATKVQQKLGKPALIGVVVAGLLSAVILAGVIVKMQTKDGTLVVEIDQPDALVQVLDAEGKVEVSQQGGVGKVTIGIDPGKHRLKVEKDGFTVFGQEFEIESGGKKAITAKLEAVKAIASATDDLDRKAAAWVLSEGGKVTVVVNQQPRVIKSINEIPVEAFRIKIVDLANTKVKDDGLKNLSSLPSVEWVNLLQTSVTDACLPPLTTLPALKDLWLLGTNVSDDGLKEIRQMKNLRFLGLNTTRITDAGLIEIAAMTNLTSMDLAKTKATATGIADLKKALPKCNINSDFPARVATTQSNKPWNTPAFQAWIKEVQVKPAEEQIEAIRKKLMELNPGFDGKVTGYHGLDNPKIENGIVTQFGFTADNLTDISPVRVLTGLEFLKCTGSGKAPCKLSDLSPLNGMKLTNLKCSSLPLLSDLSPLKGMPLTTLFLQGTQTSDLSPLQGMPLTSLHLGGNKLTDLSPLRGMKLTNLSFAGTNIADLSPLEACDSLRDLHVKNTKVTPAGVAALQKALPNCKIDWDDPAKVTTLPAPLGPAPPLAKAPFNSAQAKAHQQAWAKHLGIEIETPNSVGQTMILIPPGEFLMGSTDEQVEAALKVAEEIKANQETKDRIQKNERPQHKVVITKPLLMSATEVTIGQFKKFAAATSYQTEAEKAEAAAKAAPPTVEAGQPPPKTNPTYLNPGYAVTDDLPAAFITWSDATAYCKWLSEQEKTLYRLPTEAEWEYACRAGTTTHYSFGDDYNELSKYGWHNKNAGNKWHPVGTLLPNPFGLFDMHGNLPEWCGDYWDEKWYSTSPPYDPNGPSVGSVRMLRSGNFSDNASLCRSAFRYPYSPSYLSHNSYNGFRCVRTFDAPSTTASVTSKSTVPVAAPAKPITDFNSPAFQAWVKEVQAMPAEEQVQAVSKKLMELNPGFDGVLTDADGKGVPKLDKNGVVGLGFSADVTDISPVRALAGLRQFRCAGRQGFTGVFSNLSPLQGMKLQGLHCSHTQVADLSPLRGMPLQHLSVHNTPVSDLAPLSEVTLHSLGFSHTKVSDLSPLKGLKLTGLDFGHTPVADLSPLEGMPLVSLKFAGTRVTRFPSLQGMPLTTVECYETSIADFSPLEDCQGLTSLLVRSSITPAAVASLQKALPNCKIEWDDPAKAATTQPTKPWNTPAFQAWVKEVQAMPAEEQIKGVSKKLVALNPGFDGKMTGVGAGGTNPPRIENGIVTEFGFNPDNVTDISPVRAFVGLTKLECEGRNNTGKPGSLSDLSPLQGLPLTGLDCNSTQVSDLSPLRGMKLTTLACGKSQVSDLSPLLGMLLTRLECFNTEVSDLSPLQGMPLEKLDFNKTKIVGLSPLQDCQRLKELCVTNTKVTPASLAALQKALPNCKIEWDDPAKATTPQPAAAGTK